VPAADGKSGIFTAAERWMAQRLLKPINLYGYLINQGFLSTEIIKESGVKGFSPGSFF
jgi:hypothetical protein